MSKIKVLLASFGLLASAAVAHAASDIGFERAAQIALERVKGLVESIERENERGKQVIEVEILTEDGVKYEVTLDAVDGTVLQVERDD